MAGYMDDDWLPPSEDEEEEAAAECELPDYGDVNFWTEVYTQQRGREFAPQEWLVSYGHFCAQGWRRFLPPGGRVLDLGCGDAEFMTEAYDDGYHDITGVDIVEPVLETMRQRNVDRPGMTYLWADAMDLSVFADESFDVVFDKSTLDALKCRGAEATSSSSAWQLDATLSFGGKGRRCGKTIGCCFAVSFTSKIPVDCDGEKNHMS
eukprot:s3873_g3.t1